MGTLIKDIVLDAAKLPADWSVHLPEFVAAKLGIALSRVTQTELLSGTVDSRRGTPKLLLTVAADITGIPASPPEEFSAFTPQTPEIPENTTLDSPLVIGTGPAGIFAALVLAQAGCRPVIIDRGEPVEQRAADYQTFIRTRQLDEESNLLIGEGGAGTFSDGKLTTRIHDPMIASVIQMLTQLLVDGHPIWPIGNLLNSMDAPMLQFPANHSSSLIQSPA